MNELGYLEDIRDALYSIATILREIEEKLPEPAKPEQEIRTARVAGYQPIAQEGDVKPPPKHP